MSRYARQVQSAIRMIQKHGQVVTWRKTVTVADASQPWKTASQTPTDFQVSVFFLRKGSSLAEALFRLMKNTDVPAGGPKGLLAAGDFRPDLTDVVLRNGQTLKVESFDVIPDNGDPVLYAVRFV